MNILFLDAFVDSLSSFLFAVLLMLDGFVYSAISTLYNVYMILAKQRILTNEAFTVISNKVTMIIGVAMLFVLAYAILRAIIDPDQMTKGKMGGTKILQGILICVFGLALTPVIFNLLYQGQDIILSNDIIGKMFFASEENIQSYEGFDIKDNDGNVIEHVEADSIKTNEYIDESAGNIVAIYMWQTFFYPDPSSELLAEEIEGNLQDYVSNPTKDFIVGSLLGIGVYAVISAFAVNPLGWPALAISAISGAVISSAPSLFDRIFNPEIKMSFAEVMATVTYNGDFGMFQMFASNVAAGEIQYTFGLSTIAGLFACYAFVSFSIDMAVRAAKLAYYQIIAPIPLILQILPKFKKNFNKWISNIVSTFVEVFVRISVIYVVVYIISNLNTLVSSESLLWANEELPMAVGLFARAILIMGLIIFAQRAPKMISETFGIDTGNMSLGLGKKLSEGGAFAVGATLGSVATAGARNLANGIINFRNQGTPGSFSEGFRRVAGIGASTVAGATSAGFRTGTKAIIDQTHGRPMKTARDMAAEASKGAEIAIIKRIEREKNREKYGSSKPEIIRGHALDIRDRITSWAIGPVDTSYMDGQVKLMNDLSGLEKSLEAIAEKKDDYLKGLMDIKDSIKNKDVMDYAYDIEVENRAKNSVSTRINNLNQGASETESAYEARLRAAGLTFSNVTERAEQVSKMQRSIIDAEKNRIMNDSTHSQYIKRSDYFTTTDSDEYKLGAEKKVQELRGLEKDIAEAKKRAVSSGLAKSFATGEPNDYTTTLNEFFSGHQSDIRKYWDVNFKVGEDASGDAIIENLGQQLASRFGEGINRGEINLQTVVNASGAVYKYTIKDSVSGNVGIYKYDSSTGDVTLDSGSDLGISNIQDIGTGRTIEEVIVSEESKANPAPAQIKTTFEAGKNYYIISPEYRNAKERQKKEREGKK